MESFWVAEEEVWVEKWPPNWVRGGPSETLARAISASGDTEHGWAGLTRMWVSGPNKYRDLFWEVLLQNEWTKTTDVHYRLVVFKVSFNPENLWLQEGSTMCQLATWWHSWWEISSWWLTQKLDWAQEKSVLRASRKNKTRKKACRHGEASVDFQMVSPSCRKTSKPIKPAVSFPLGVHTPSSFHTCPRKLVHANFWILLPNINVWPKE